MAATNKYLAQSNKSGTRAEATKKRRAPLTALPCLSLPKETKVKSLLLAAAAVLAVTAAQAETIYVTPGSAVQWVAPQPFKTVFNGNEKLLEVHGGATNRDLVVVANATPEETIIASADLLVIDGNGKVVDTLRVVVSPLRPKPEEDVKTFNIVRPGHSTSHLMCADRTCIDTSPKSGNKSMGDADSITKTTYKDGSTGTTKTWSTPPTPPTP
jgi:hypothetical protein